MKDRIVLFFLMFTVTLAGQNRFIDSLQQLINNAETEEEALVQKANLVVKYFTSGEIKKQRKLYNEAIRQARTLNSPRALGHLYKTRGILLYYESKFDSALFYFDKSLSLMQEANDKVGILKATSNIGAIYYMRMDYQKALEYFDRGLKLEVELNYREGEHVSLNNVATIYLTMKMYDNAMRYFRKAEKILLETQGTGDLAFTYDGLATLYMEEKKFDSAMYYARKCLAISESLEDKSAIAYSYLNIGIIQMAEKKFNDALISFRKAVPLTRELDDKRLLLGILANIASAYTQMDMLDSAYTYVEKVIPLQEELKHQKFEEGLSLLYAEYYARRNDYKKAFAYLSKHRDISDSIYNTEMVIKTAELQEKFETEKKDKQNQLLYAENEKHKTTRNYLLIVVGLALLCIIGGVFAYRKISRAKTLINQQKNLVEEKQKEILDSINYARRIQFALLASDQLLNKHLPEHFVLFKPKSVVSGDFYWAAPLGDDFVLLTGDCTGHGVPGAFMSLLNISKLSQVINEQKITRPDLVLNEVRSEIIAALNPEGHEAQGNDGMDAVLYKLNFRKMRLEYSAANNSFYIVRDAKVLHCKADKMPVGKGHNDEISFTYNEIKLEKGDIIYSFSDGYADQFGGPDGKKFKYKQLEELILKIHKEPMSVQKQKLEEVFDTWRGELEQVDDVCIIGVRVS
jgi:serine phosphatase RsbU (regulator of sigma subunit)